jgi:hypothetical protein
MSPSTQSTWAIGYGRFNGRRHVRHGPVITSLDAESMGGPTIPFIGLVEAAVVQAFRRTGLSMQRIRRALEVLIAEALHALAPSTLAA